MTSTQQGAALQRQIWQIANDVRGAVEGWDFKQYVLGTLFIDASGLFRKETDNTLTEQHIEAKDNREVVDIAQRNAELKTTVVRIDELRKEIDAIVAEVEA